MGFPSNYEDFPMNWVGDVAGRRALITPNLPAVLDVTSDRRYTYAEMNERANHVGVFLKDELGLQKGDVICVLGRNRIEQIDLFLACGKTGVILSPLSYRLQKTELDDLLKRINPKAVFYEDVFANLAESLALPASVKTFFKLGDSIPDYAEKILSTEVREVNEEIALNETWMYVHTGGTTAVPKICIVPYRQMIWNVFDIMVTASGGLTRKEILTFPMFHIGGWNVFNSLFHSGGQAILMREFEPGLVLELIEKEQLDHFGGVEAMFQFMIAHPNFKNADLSSLRAITSAAAPCSEEVMRPFWDKGIAVKQAYGLTEGGPSNFAYVPRTDSMYEVVTNAGKIGTPMFHCDYKIVDQETRQPVKKGEVGVLCLRSSHNFGGYLGDEERTEKLVDENGYIFTGDLAIADDQGLVQIVGRADNMFITGGENVSPEEIEQALQKHPAVAGAICCGIKDAKWGQVPVALVVFHAGQTETEDEIRGFLREHLASFKVPKMIIVADALPLTGAGKLDRNALRKMVDAK